MDCRTALAMTETGNRVVAFRNERAGPFMLRALAANRQNDRFIGSALNEIFGGAHDWPGFFENLFVAGAGGLRHAAHQQIGQSVVCYAVGAVDSAFFRTAGKSGAGYCGIDWRQRVNAGGCAIAPPDRLASASVRR